MYKSEKLLLILFLQCLPLLPVFSIGESDKEAVTINLTVAPWVKIQPEESVVTFTIDADMYSQFVDGTLGPDSYAYDVSIVVQCNHEMSIEVTSAVFDSEINNFVSSKLKYTKVDVLGCIIGKIINVRLPGTIEERLTGDHLRLFGSFVWPDPTTSFDYPKAGTYEGTITLTASLPSQ